jgi:hypothetical protein
MYKLKPPMLIWGSGAGASACYNRTKDIDTMSDSNANVQQILSELAAALKAEAQSRETQNAEFHARLKAEAQARAEFETLSQLRGRAIDARLNSQAMHIELLSHETHALGIKLEKLGEKVDALSPKVVRISDSVDTLKQVVAPLVQLARNNEERISALVRKN